jgi:D-alanyl-D-alanine carboxypeptidase (penicillin-binding protein 5/6)
LILKQLKLWQATFLLLAVLFTFPVQAAVRDLPQVSARAWVMMDLDSGYILSSYNQYLPMHPGDLTKLMSGYVLFRVLSQENVSLDSPVTIPQGVRRVDGARIFLKPGERVTTDKLLNAMLIHSANDATLALAEHYVGSEKNLVEKMNRQAHVLGMTRTRFSNITGLPDIHQASTAADLALLAQAIINQFPQYQDFFKTRKLRYHDINYFNRNAMLWRDPTTSGLMASVNEITGVHLIFTSSRPHQNLVVVILGAPNEQRLFEGAQALLDYGRRNFETRLLYPARKVLAEVTVNQGSAPNVPVGMLENLFVTLPKGTFDRLNARIEVEPSINAPVETGQDTGHLTLTFGDKTVADHTLVALEPVPVGNALQQAWGRFRHWLSGDTGNQASTQE